MLRQGIRLVVKKGDADSCGSTTHNLCLGISTLAWMLSRADSLLEVRGGPSLSYAIFEDRIERHS